MSVADYLRSHLDEETTLRRALLTYGVIFAYFAVFLFPVLYLISATFLPRGALFSDSLLLLPTPETFTLENWARVFSQSELTTYVFNSTIIALTTTVVALSVSVIGAYSLSRFDYPGSDYLILMFLSTQMLPFILIIIPFFTIMLTLNLVDSHVGIVVAHSVSAIPFCLWLLKGYFDDIPQSLDEAAKLDGCSELQVLTRVILPLSVPGISVASFYTFVLSWNEFVAVSLLSQSPSTRTLPFALFLFQNGNVVDWGATLAMAVVTMVPVIILFALVQRYVVKGLATGGTKGL
jgi:ABC-type glycerol-3-phosphate transport system permease component